MKSRLYMFLVFLKEKNPCEEKKEKMVMMDIRNGYGSSIFMILVVVKNMLLYIL